RADVVRGGGSGLLFLDGRMVLWHYVGHVDEECVSPSNSIRNGPRTHIEPDPRVMGQLKQMSDRAEATGSLEELLGIEGNAARLYFGAFQGLLKAEPDETVPEIYGFDFNGRNRRPPRDA